MNSFSENGIIETQIEDPFHTALRQVLAGIDVREFLEDVTETEHAIPDPEDDNSSLSSFNPESETSDPEFELNDDDDESSSDDDNVDGYDCIAVTLNDTLHLSEEEDAVSNEIEVVPSPSVPGVRRSNRQLEIFRKNLS